MMEPVKPIVVPISPELLADDSMQSYIKERMEMLAAAVERDALKEAAGDHWVDLPAADEVSDD